MAEYEKLVKRLRNSMIHGLLEWRAAGALESLVKERDGKDELLRTVQVTNNEIWNASVQLRKQLSAIRKAVESARRDSEFSMSFGTKVQMSSEAWQRILDAVNADHLRDATKMVPAQQVKKCPGCNGHGAVGNILDTVECPFYKGSGNGPVQQGESP